MNKYLFWGLLGFVFMVSSCANEDDVCTSGEGTARMKIKFKDTNNKIVKPDTLYIDVDYVKGKVNVLSKAVAPDSALIPLRVDESTFTEIYIRKRKVGPAAKIKLNYSIKSQYVSPACGIKRLYEGLGAELSTPNPVVGTQINLTEITDENKTHLYLIF